MAPSSGHNVFTRHVTGLEDSEERMEDAEILQPNTGSQLPLLSEKHKHHVQTSRVPHSTMDDDQI